MNTFCDPFPVCDCTLLSKLYSANMLAVLAKVLFMVPHSASVERAFSDFGWFQSKHRNPLNPETIVKLTAIKRAPHTEEREANKRHAPSATVSTESDDQETSLSVGA